jgi:predicted O-methyltransferase YrrM
LINPKAGTQIFQALRESGDDRKYKTHDYKTGSSNVIDTLKTIFPSSDFTIKQLQSQLSPLQDSLKSFFERIGNEEYPSKKKPYPIDYSLNEQSGIFLYALCKIMKPDKVVETGVAYGLSSSYVLQALHENERGELYSIDSVFRPWESKEMIGSAIPSHLKHRWRFTFGKSTDNLKNLFDSLQQADIFLHDSLHTFKNMMFEFSIAWPYLKKNGILIADDIVDNDAFYQFYSSRNLEPIFLTRDNENTPILGILRKNHV